MENTTLDTNKLSLLEYFYEWEELQPNRIFLRQPEGKKWKDISWKETGSQARRMAAALLDMGLVPGDNVGILSKNCYHWIITDLALMMSGLISVPFYPNSTLNSIGDGTFRESGITFISIPNTVTTIGNSCFFNCTSLTSITLSSTLNNIGNNTFQESGLTTINIPNTVKTIGNAAFSSCNKLTSVTFSLTSTLHTIGNGIFRESGLKSITIPDSITSIGDSAFLSCSSLTTVIVEDQSKITSLGSNLFLNTLSDKTILFYNTANYNDLTIKRLIASFDVNNIYYNSGPPRPLPCTPARHHPHLHPHLHRHT